MLQTPLFDGPSLDPFSLEQDGLATLEADVWPAPDSEAFKRMRLKPKMQIKATYVG